MPENVRFLPFGPYLTLKDFMLSEEREYVLASLVKHQWNYSASARALGITFRALRYRCQCLGLGWKKDLDPTPKPKRKDSEFERAFPKLRATILRKYNGRCLCCGKTAKDGVKIHVDHIKPRSKFPELALDPENLQTLCEPCNLSKSNKDQTDWR